MLVIVQVIFRLKKLHMRIGRSAVQPIWLELVQVPHFHLQRGGRPLLADNGYRDWVAVTAGHQNYRKEEQWSHTFEKVQGLKIVYNWLNNFSMLTFPATISSTFSMVILSCAMLSRSLIVSVPSSKDWWSTVRQ